MNAHDEKVAPLFDAGQQFEHDVYLFLNRTYDSVYNTGLEFMHPALLSALKFHKSMDAACLRMFPDFVAFNEVGQRVPELHFYEAKSSPRISKLSYHSLVLHDRFGKVFLIAKTKSGMVLAQRARLIRFLPVPEHYNTDGDGWVIQPEDKGSGMPFRYLDSDSMYLIPNFYGNEP